MNLEELRKFKPQIMELASKYGVSEIKVFGSVARGDADENSDVDLLIDRFEGTLLTFVYFKEKMEDLLGSKVDLIQIKNVKNPLRKKYMLEDATVL